MVKKQNRGRIRKISNPILKQAPTTAKIKVQLDSRTVITIHDMSALAAWLIRYPNAKVL